MHVHLNTKSTVCVLMYLQQSKTAIIQGTDNHARHITCCSTKVCQLYPAETLTNEYVWHLTFSLHALILGCLHEVIEIYLMWNPHLPLCLRTNTSVCQISVKIGRKFLCKNLSFFGKHKSWDNHIVIYSVNNTTHRGADKSLARPTSGCILFDGENISFDASHVYI
jgi:hypothetical protein